MAYWLAKSEPSTYSWQRFVQEKRTCWDGVRNAQARNNLAAMKKGDEVLFYHSGADRAVVGIATVARTAYQDPTTDDDRWVAVDLAAKQELASPVPLAAIRKKPSLADIALIRQSRLSVMPLKAAEFRAIVSLGKA